MNHQTEISVSAIKVINQNKKIILEIEKDIPKITVIMKIDQIDATIAVNVIYVKKSE
jgi:hypothetical protein